MSGLKNFGNSCYMNASLQLLLNNALFMKEMEKNKKLKLCQLMINLKATSGAEDVLEELFDLLVEEDIVKKGKVQWDVHSFYLGFFDYFSRRKIEIKTFQFVYQTVTECSSSMSTCPLIRKETLVPNYVPKFHAKLYRNVKELVTDVERMDRSKLSGYCKKCISTQYKSDQISVLPPCTLLRIDRGKDITMSCTVDHTIFLSAMKKTRIKMKLSGAVIHHGKSENEGHYFSVVREGDNWVKYDDDKRKEISQTSFEKFLGGMSTFSKVQRPLILQYIVADMYEEATVAFTMKKYVPKYMQTNSNATGSGNSSPSQSNQGKVDTVLKKDISEFFRLQDDYSTQVYNLIQKMSNQEKKRQEETLIMKERLMNMKSAPSTTSSGAPPSPSARKGGEKPSLTNAEIEEMKREINRVQKKLNERNEKIKKLNIRLQELELSENERVIKKVTDDNELKNEVDNLKHTVKVRNKRITDLEGLLKFYKKEVKKEQNDKSKLQNFAEKLTSTGERLKQEKKQSNRKINMLEKKIKNLELDKNKASMQITTLMEANNTHEKNIRYYKTLFKNQQF